MIAFRNVHVMHGLHWPYSLLDARCLTSSGTIRPTVHTCILKTYRTSVKCRHRPIIGSS